MTPLLRVLSGVTCGPRRGDFERIAALFYLFGPAQHDSVAKVVLGRVWPAGRGIEDGNDVLEILARYPSIASSFGATTPATYWLNWGRCRRCLPCSWTLRMRRARVSFASREMLATAFASPDFQRR